jgi:hypothetical protein
MRYRRIIMKNNATEMRKATVMDYMRHYSGMYLEYLRAFTNKNNDKSTLLGFLFQISQLRRKWNRVPKTQHSNQPKRRRIIFVPGFTPEYRVLHTRTKCTCYFEVSSSTQAVCYPSRAVLAIDVPQ